jgi:endonuclease/exonuclease/phosphatase family metal-dependent hydrolase
MRPDVLGLVGLLEQRRLVLLEEVQLTTHDIVEPSSPKHAPRVRRLTLLVRTWNVFHGNAFPPARRGYLREAIELVTADEPDVVCLQELPAWAMSRLGGWTGLQSLPALARRPVLRGSMPGWVTRLHQGWLRSALVGQANAILVSRSLDVEDLGRQEISDKGRERRIVQAARIAPRFIVANLHASRARHGPEVVRDEIERSREFAENLARPGDAIVLAGDFNIPAISLPGYSEATSGLDHVLVKGAKVGPPVVWPEDRRRHGRVVLSDHTPVEVTIE